VEQLIGLAPVQVVTVLRVGHDQVLLPMLESYVQVAVVGQLEGLVPVQEVVVGTV
jgi:hypothetical protein